MVESMLRDALEVLKHNDRARAAAVARRTAASISWGARFAAILPTWAASRLSTTGGKVRGARNILSAVINLEHIADIVANSLVEFAVRSGQAGLGALARGARDCGRNAP